MKGKSAHPFSKYHQITKIKLPIGFVIWEGRLGISKKRYVHIYVYTNHIYICIYGYIYWGCGEQVPFFHKSIEENPEAATVLTASPVFGDHLPSLSAWQLKYAKNVRPISSSLQFCW